MQHQLHRYQSDRGDIHDLVIAQLFIAKTTVSIPQSRITDTRLNAMLCGVVAVPTQVDVTSVFNQFQGALDEYLELVEKAIDGTLAGNLQGQITEVRITANSAQSTATSAQSKATAAMPKGGGTFTGNVNAVNSNRSTSCLRNTEVRITSPTGALQATNSIIMVRK